MFLAFSIVLLTIVTANGAQPAASTELRVCADPNNLPFSNQQGEGFENALARLVARDLGRSVTYTWWPQRRGFIRNTLRAGRCDVVMGIPAAFELAQPTRPYYRSTYVFVTRRDRGLDIRSFDDPILKQLKIGIHVIGDDYANVPPAQALVRRGIIGNVRGYSIYGDYSQPNPPAMLIDAVAQGQVDLAIAWGPLAGYFATRSPIPLSIVPVAPLLDPPSLSFVFDISMGVRREAQELRAVLDQVIERRQLEIRSLLEQYGVPLAGRGTP
jgi:quinoprotein dehydrogenase-associated probable ABC transporter substrate-binding protein